MASTRAAQRYAKALLELATEKQQAEAVTKDMQTIKNTLNDSQELRNVLKSPVINPTLKRNSLKEIFKGCEPITLNLFDVLLQNGRVNILDKVVDQYIKLFDEKNNIKVAYVTTATALTPEMEAKVLAKVKELTGSKATLVNKIDESILGGFILRIDDLQYNASISGKFNRLKNKFKNNAYV